MVRGIDFYYVCVVFNFDLFLIFEVYIYRVGRWESWGEVGWVFG